MSNTEQTLSFFPTAMEPGATLRDYFAGQALIGRMEEHGVHYASDIARQCYELADAMIAERAASRATEGK